MKNDTSIVGDEKMASREIDDARIERQLLAEGPSLAEMIRDVNFKRELDEWWDDMMQREERKCEFTHNVKDRTDVDLAKAKQRPEEKK